MYSFNKIIALLGVIAFALVSVGGGSVRAQAVLQPSVVTLTATNVGQTAATLNGSVNPNGSNTTVWAEYGLTQSFGQNTPHQSIGSLNAYQVVSVPVYSLLPNTTYYFRIMAENQYGIVQGQTVSFMTTTNVTGGGAPQVTTQSPTNVTLNGATLQAQVIPNNGQTNVWFEYGPTMSLGQNTTQQLFAAGTTPFSSQIALSNLLPNTTYYYRAAAQNPSGSSYGLILSFTTYGTGSYGSGAPQATTQGSTAVAATTATMNGSVIPNSGSGYYYPTSVWIEYGTTQSFGNRIDINQQLTGTASVPVYGNAWGLQPNVTYYYRVVAQNSAGISQGQTLTFTTLGGGYVPPTPAYCTYGQAPVVTTLAATNVDLGSAQLSGSAVPNSQETTLWFEFGRTRNLGGTGGYRSVGAGNVSASHAILLNGLRSGTTYYYRVAARNACGTRYGEIASFRTLGATPVWIEPAATTTPTSTVESGTAQLSLVATLDAAGVKRGDQLEYKVVVRNGGIAAAENVSLAISVSQGVEYVSATPAPASNGNGSLTFSLASLAPKTEQTVTVRFKVKNDVAADAVLGFPTVANYNDPRNAQTASANVSAVVQGAPAAPQAGNDESRTDQTASVRDAFSDLTPSFWLLIVLLLMSVANFYYQYARDKRLERQGIIR